MKANDRSVELPDGRQIAIRETGDPAGFPVLVLGGIPGGCRLEADRYDDLGRQAALRILGVDRPGIGLSDRHPGATMQDWTGDVESLATSLEIERFAVLAVSGGTSFALALGWALPERVDHVTLVAPAWLPNTASTRGMALMNRVVWWSAHHSRRLFGFIFKRMMLPSLSNPDFSIASGFPEPDQKALADHPEIETDLKAAFMEAVRNGADGVVDDAILGVAPPPFSLPQVTVPVVLWHGEADCNAPIAIGRQLANELPNCEAHFIPGEGHISILVHQLDAIFARMAKQVQS